MQVKQRKISIYMDNVLTHVNDPAIPALIGNLKEHGNFSGQQINQSNSEAIMLVERWPMELAGTFDFRWSNSGF